MIRKKLDEGESNISIESFKGLVDQAVEEIKGSEQLPVYINYLRHGTIALERNPDGVDFIVATDGLADHYLRFIMIQNRISNFFVSIIPSIGFIGTVVGISQALSTTVDMQSSIIATKQIAQSTISAQIGLAFDTTLVALGLSVVALSITQFVYKLESFLIADTKSSIDDEFLAIVDKSKE